MDGIERKQSRETEQARGGGRTVEGSRGDVIQSCVCKCVCVCVCVCVWTPEIHLSPAAEASLLLPDLIKNTLL